MNIAIITARGGSKGIPKKNLCDLGGKPLVLHTIEAAQESGCFDIICVTTDDQEIAHVAQNSGAEVVMRPAHLAQDGSRSIDAVLHVLNHFEEQGIQFEDAVLLQPTSPFRSKVHIQNALTAYKDQNECRSLASFSEVPDHPYKCFYLNEDNHLKAVFGNKYLSFPRQELPRVIKHNGAIYINKVPDLKKYESFFVEPVYPFMMEMEDSLDIDNAIDLEFAEFLLSDV